jgi:tight adherence protein B
MILLAAFFLAVSFFGVVFYVLTQFWGSEGKLQRDKDLKKRLFSGEETSTSDTPDFIKRSQISQHRFLEDFLEQYSLVQNIALFLQRSKLKFSVAFFFLFSLFLGVIGFFVFRHYLGASFAAVAALLVALLPFVYLKIQNKRYLKKFEENFPDAIVSMSSSMRVGHGIETAIGTIAETAVYPINVEFEAIGAELKLGVPLALTLKNFYKRISLPEVKIMATGIALHQELGGNLTEVLDNLEKTIRDRFTIKREIQVLSAQGRMSSYVLILIPFVLAAGLYLLDTKNFTSFLSSGPGHMVLMLNALVMVVSFFWMQAIVNLKE